MDDELSSSSSDDSEIDDDEIDDEDDPSHFLIAGPNHTGVGESFKDEEDDTRDQGLDTYATDGEKLSRKPKSMKREKSVEADLGESYRRENSSMSTTVQSKSGTSSGMAATDDPDPPVDVKKKATRKHTAVIGRVAKTVKNSTVVTGKHVIKHSKTIGKGTVIAGRAVGKGTVAAGRAIPVSSVVSQVRVPNKAPTKHEPGGRLHRRSSNHMKVMRKAMKNIEGNFTSLSSGQLLPPGEFEQEMSL